MKKLMKKNSKCFLKNRKGLGKLYEILCQFVAIDEILTKKVDNVYTL